MKEINKKIISSAKVNDHLKCGQRVFCFKWDDLMAESCSNSSEIRNLTYEIA